MQRLEPAIETRVNDKKKLEFILEGREILYCNRITKVYEFDYEVNEETGKYTKLVAQRLISSEVKQVQEFYLREVTVEELADIRKGTTPGFVIKDNKKYYYTSIDSNMRLFDEKILGKHMCARVGKECNRLSAASDANGGCAKVRNRSSCIEKYDWITVGFETFNTFQNVFVVVKCEHYEAISNEPRYTVPVIR